MSTPEVTAVKGDVNRHRTARAQAQRIGLRMVKLGTRFELYDRDGQQVFVGTIDGAEEWLAKRSVPKRPGPAPHTVPPLWRPWIELLVGELRAAKRAQGTIDLRVKRLTAFARAHPGSDPRTVTRQELVKYLGDNDAWTPEYAHSVRTSLRVFFGLLDDLELRPNNPARRLPRILIPRAVPRPCPDGAILAALGTVTDERVQLAIRIGADTGLRRMEIAGLRRDSVEGWAGEWRLRVRGKGGHERVVPIDDELAERLLASQTAHIFPGVAGGHITPRHLGKLIAQALPDKYTAHTLRHRYATAVYEATTDIRVTQELLGHASPATTAIYTKVSDDAMRRAATAVRLPTTPATT